MKAQTKTVAKPNATLPNAMFGLSALLLLLLISLWACLITGAHARGMDNAP